MELKHFYLLVLVTLNSLDTACFFRDSFSDTTGNIPKACGKMGVCHCVESSSGTYVDCSNEGLFNVPRDFPNTTTFLYLGYNQLSVLPADAFKGLRLAALDLENNSLSTVPRNAFNGLISISAIFLSNNKLSYIPEVVLEDMESLWTLDVSGNQISTLRKNAFKHLKSLSSLFLGSNQISSLPATIFDGLKLLYQLQLQDNNLHILPPMLFKDLPSLQMLRLDGNSLTPRNNTFCGLSNLTEIFLSRNKIKELPIGSLRGFVHVWYLDLSDNKIEQIPPGLFNQSSWKKLTVLFLQRNNLKVIHRDAFIGLSSLSFLCLYSNQIHTIEENVFAQMDLQYLYLFQNNVKNITGSPFKSDGMKQLHIYGNEIEYIDTQSLQEISEDTIIYLSCEFLDALPRNYVHDKIECVSTSSLPSSEVNGDGIINERTADALARSGFTCSLLNFTMSICKPCGAGTYGGDIGIGGCHSCPKGGFYQDEVAQTVAPSTSEWNIPCKVCNKGTYVIEGEGTSPKDCGVCPGGTNQTVDAGYRACYCKTGYSRTDRYGPCYKCPQEGLDCSKEFQALLPGYMWNWSFPDANLTKYVNFVDNIKVSEDLSETSNYSGEIPRVIRCPNADHCPNNDTITGNCATGYTGWLCTNCEPGYYSVLNSCVLCPSLTILIIECCVFFIVCSLACFLLSWQVKRKSGKKDQVRSVVDVIIARIKILLGFYQVIGEIITSIHDIKWNGPLIVMGKFITAFELNILKLFVRPRCFNEKLDINPKLQFLIGVISPGVILIFLLLIYLIRRLYIRMRFAASVRKSMMSHIDKLKASLIACIIVLWFIIYPPVCSVIFSVYPISCKTFALDQNHTYVISRLRSDFDIDCKGMESYHISAFIFTVLYVIAFPVALLYLLRRNYTQSCHVMNGPTADNNDDVNVSMEISNSTETSDVTNECYNENSDDSNAPVITNATIQSSCMNNSLAEQSENNSLTNSSSHGSPSSVTELHEETIPSEVVFEGEDDSLQSSTGLGDNGEETTSFIISNSENVRRSTWINFLCENYKEKFWFWEVVELTRKVTQTLFITFYGWEDRLTVILTTCISVLFLLLHARYQPMKSSYEQRLQMVSLTVIFLNVVVAANDFPDEHEGPISTTLLLLNIIVLLLIAGELLVTIVIHLKHIKIAGTVLGTFRRLRGTNVNH